MRRIIIYWIFASAALSVWAAAPDNASAPYAKGDYQTAIAGYTDMMEKNGESASLLYNLGNCYYQSGNRHSAVLCYERALRLDPGNKEIKNNLAYLSSKVADANRAEAKGKNVRTAEDAESFFESLRNSIAREHSSNMWAGMAAGAFVLFIVCCALYVFISNVLVRKIGFFAGILVAVCAILFIPFSYMAARNQTRDDEAVVKAYKTVLLTDPDAESKPSSLPLTTGTKVRILNAEPADSEKPAWYKVRLNSDYVGWIQADKIEVI